MPSEKLAFANEGDLIFAASVRTAAHTLPDRAAPYFAQLASLEAVDNRNRKRGIHRSFRNRARRNRGGLGIWHGTTAVSRMASLDRLSERCDPEFTAYTPPASLFMSCFELC
jgi:hypothetical protein